MSNKDSKISHKTFDDFPAKVRREYFAACACLRVFAYYEQPVFIHYTAQAFQQAKTTLASFLSKEKKSCPFCKVTKSQNLAGAQLRQEIRSTFTKYAVEDSKSWIVYAMFDNCICYCQLFTSLSRHYLKTSYFDPITFELTNEGVAYRDKLRSKWEHSIDLPMNLYDFIARARPIATSPFSETVTYYYASSQHLYELLTHYLEAVIETSTLKAVDLINKDLQEAFGDLALDQQSVSGPQLYEELGLDTLPEYALRRTTIDQIKRQNCRKHITGLLLAFQENMQENLTNANYINRLVGRIQYSRDVK